MILIIDNSSRDQYRMEDRIGIRRIQSRQCEIRKIWNLIIDNQFQMICINNI